jgi:hypothetical protein
MPNVTIGTMPNVNIATMPDVNIANWPGPLTPMTVHVDNFPSGGQDVNVTNDHIPVSSYSTLNVKTNTN